ncbi:uncharacterized protein [Triticum aestivum]|uniref:uncharacterized protein isoform X2 n=1 Tax=Triticum aestivum TaxID=4565 RepID=UPI001D012D74|nr:uncharacterized protein LOC123191055 isoform X2 [Triticum aestivum]
MVEDWNDLQEMLLPLHVILLMDRLQWWDLTREAAIYLIQLYAPGSSLGVLTTSAESRIRVGNGDELLAFSTDLKGFSNTGSQISASVAPEGKSVVCVCL